MKFTDMWNDPVTAMKGDEIEKHLGGNLKGIGNFCCVRVSHALHTAGVGIGVASDFKDKAGNKYIIRCVTMVPYLKTKFNTMTVGTKETDFIGKQGIIFFKVNFSDATGHVDLWNGSSVRYESYFGKASEIILFEC